MLPFDLRTIARALGGEVAGSQVLCPGPNHGPKDRSLSVKPSSTAPDGFLAHSFAGDGPMLCRDHVRALLGLRRQPRDNAPRRPSGGRRQASRPPAQDDGRDEKIAAAIALWRQCVDPRGTLAERYLAGRGLELEYCRRGHRLASRHQRDGRVVSQHRDQQAAGGLADLSRRAGPQVSRAGRWARSAARRSCSTRSTPCSRAFTSARVSRRACRPECSACGHAGPSAPPARSRRSRPRRDRMPDDPRRTRRRERARHGARRRPLARAAGARCSSTARTAGKTSTTPSKGATDERRPLLHDGAVEAGGAGQRREWAAQPGRPAPTEEDAYRANCGAGNGAPRSVSPFRSSSRFVSSRTK